MSACRIHCYFHPQKSSLSLTSSHLPCPLSRISALNQKWKRESCENHISLISLTLSLYLTLLRPTAHVTHKSSQQQRRSSTSSSSFHPASHNPIAIKRQDRNFIDFPLLYVAVCAHRHHHSLPLHLHWPVFPSTAAAAGRLTPAQPIAPC